MINIVIADTNLIIRYLVADDDELFKKAELIFAQVQNGTYKLVIEVYVVTEIIYVLNSFYKTPREEIKSTLLDLFAYKGILIDKDLITKALYIFSSTNLHIVDCLLAAKSIINNQELVTFDKDLKNYMTKDKIKK